METSTTPPAAFSIDEAARQLSIGRSSVYALIKTGDIRIVKIGRRTIIPAAEIARIISSDRRDDS